MFFSVRLVVCLPVFSSALLRFFFQNGHALPLLGRSPAKVHGVRAYCRGFPA